MAVNAVSTWHTVTPTVLGELTLVRDARAMRGLYFPHHWSRPDPAAFGPRRDEGFDREIEQLDEYLEGRRHSFDLAVEPGGDEFQRRVWNELRQVPYGDTVTYGDLAGRLRDGATAQQVGAAVARNPLCIVIACHRVVGAGGKLTGYAGGLARKKHLLDLEQSAQPPSLLFRDHPGPAVGAG
ncbi:methylated-DNA--[protein]-cysteine S-methyltransferase [Pseudonocardia sp. GCM10023141]|uniref:methylated-DNA--[protein]-cysteine S-methyltransferase n=1 Tax=Pseudonocardia sp. GCM10023141 TaxID=3252653 RepID=UPI00362397F8